jgi:hypothetical protein
LTVPIDVWATAGAGAMRMLPTKAPAQVHAAHRCVIGMPVLPPVKLWCVFGTTVGRYPDFSVKVNYFTVTAGEDPC